MARNAHLFLPTFVALAAPLTMALSWKAQLDYKHCQNSVLFIILGFTLLVSTIHSNQLYIISRYDMRYYDMIYDI